MWLGCPILASSIKGVLRFYWKLNELLWHVACSIRFSESGRAKFRSKPLGVAGFSSPVVTAIYMLNMLTALRGPKPAALNHLPRGVQESKYEEILSWTGHTD